MATTRAPTASAASTARMPLLALLMAAGSNALILGVTPRMPLQSRPSMHPSRSALTEVVCGRKGRPAGAGGKGMPQGAMPAQQSGMSAPDPPGPGECQFYLYCRTKSRVMNYPVSMMRGDGQAKSLVNAWINSPFGKGIFKNRLDAGMAKSIFESERRLADLARRQYPALKKQRELEWGFKIVDYDLQAKVAKGEMEEPKITFVTRDMVEESFIEKARKAVGA